MHRSAPAFQQGKLWSKSKAHVIVRQLNSPCEHKCPCVTVLHEELCVIQYLSCFYLQACAFQRRAPQLLGDAPVRGGPVTCCTSAQTPTPLPTSAASLGTQPGSQPQHAVVVGAGPAGCLMAMYLARAGVCVSHGTRACEGTGHSIHPGAYVASPVWLPAFDMSHT